MHSVDTRDTMTIAMASRDKALQPVRTGAIAAAAVAEPVVTVLRTASGNMVNYNYLISDPVTRLGVLLDPAWEIDAVERALHASGTTLSGILLTHSHADHVDLARVLATKYGCPVWMSEQEILASSFDAPGLVAIDETPWTLGRMLIEPLLTPGHTSGSVCYRIGRNLFTGDVLFAEGCGLCPDAAGARRMFESLERLKRDLDPETRIYPGHSFGKPPGQTFADILEWNIYLHFRDPDAFAAFRLRQVRDRARQFDFR
jgi:hydroxyacylglutathione hydrolase